MATSDCVCVYTCTFAPCHSSTSFLKNLTWWSLSGQVLGGPPHFCRQWGWSSHGVDLRQPVSLSPCRGAGSWEWSEWLGRFREHLLNNELYLEEIAPPLGNDFGNFYDRFFFLSRGPFWACCHSWVFSR